MINRRISRSLRVAFLGTAVLMAPLTAIGAQSRIQPVTVTAQHDPFTRIVPFGDLSIGTKGGKHELLHRVDLAVSEVCPDFDDWGWYDQHSCAHRAWEGAWPQIRSALNASGTGAALATTISISAGPNN